MEIKEVFLEVVAERWENRIKGMKKDSADELACERDLQAETSNRQN